MDQMATDIGSRLQQARQVRGLTIRDIATITKISAVALEAIERNDFARLPGGLFGRAYVRAFAAEVGLNADELARDYRERVETDVSACPLLVHEADSGDHARALRWLVAVVIIGGGLLIGALLISNTAHSPQEPSGEERLVVGQDGEAVTLDITRDSNGHLYADPAVSDQGTSRRSWSRAAHGTPRPIPV